MSSSCGRFTWPLTTAKCARQMLQIRILNFEGKKEKEKGDHKTRVPKEPKKDLPNRELHRKHQTH
jgi:hypothetical protein